MTETSIQKLNLPFGVNNMAFIKGGSFMMGDTLDEKEIIYGGPLHRVELADFYLNAFCVTMEEYCLYCFATGRKMPPDEGWGRGKLPAKRVSWYDAVEYCNFLSAMNGLEPVYEINKNPEYPNDYTDFDTLKWEVSANWNANGYRLPTEAEWEYAARERGKPVRFGNGQNTIRPSEVNFNSILLHKEFYSEIGDYRAKTMPVNSFQPNALGLYNMSGNISEWCWDLNERDYYKISPIDNPRGPETGGHRIIRGGGWNTDPQRCKTTHRTNECPSCQWNWFGLRLACNS